MTMPVAGNAAVANLWMRFPVATSVIATAVAITAIATPAPAPAPAPVPVVVAPAPAPVPAPAVLVKETPKPLEFVCPPVEKTRKLSKAEKKQLVEKGCKIRG